MARPTQRAGQRTHGDKRLRRRPKPQWDTKTDREPLMHRIHGYPAKFPSFIASRALEHARSVGIKVRCMADVFCGCGTTALEARRQGVDFWGCDINPVATLIARVKSQSYQAGRLKRYQRNIVKNFASSANSVRPRAHPKRLDYWFTDKQIVDLQRMQRAIMQIPEGKYRDFFLCAFSNILKPLSRWLTKSIKPQVDPKKVCPTTQEIFTKQCARMIQAVEQVAVLPQTSTAAVPSKIAIFTGNFLDFTFKNPVADLLVTSPPYVTSYEYADLHQLSTLWLGYVDDYRDLRAGAIGSLYHASNFFDHDANQLKGKGKSTVLRLYAVDRCKARATARYFLDIQKMIKKSRSLLRRGGMILLVVGNTEYKGVEIDNAGYIQGCLKATGYRDISRTRRRISSKTLTPYRNSLGEFTKNSKGRQVYAEEFVFTARR
jgi:methylase of polypeptide subunit release factors